MYRKKNREKQVEEVTISLEALVPEKHILRAIDKAFWIRSMRQTIKEIEVNVEMVHRLFVDGTCSPFLYPREKLCSAICLNRHF